MKKASKKETTKTSPAKEPRESIRAVAPVQLGTKRACPKCSTKFYDFGKTDLVCPKCEAKVSPDEIKSVRLAAAPKKSTPKPVAPASSVPATGDEPIAASAEGEEVIESVDDLGDDEDEEIVEDLVDEDAEDQEF